MMPNCIAALIFQSIRYRCEMWLNHTDGNVWGAESERVAAQRQPNWRGDAESERERRRAAERVGESERKSMSGWAIIGGGERMSDNPENVDNKTTCAFQIQNCSKKKKKRGSESSERCVFVFVSWCWMKTIRRARRIAVCTIRDRTLTQGHWLRAAMYT